MHTYKYITFDCYGTLTNFRIAEVTRARMSDRIPAERMRAFLGDYAAYRFDEVLGAWKPYPQVLHDSLQRTCRRWNVAFDAADASTVVDAVPTWGPHADVPAGLSRLAREVPLVILSNAANDQIHSNVAKLGAPFHAVFTAEDAGAYKPRFQAFEYMFDSLGCAPGDILHVSSSLRYDLISARALGIGERVFVDRGHDAPNPAYEYRTVDGIDALPELLGL
ncbi:MAG: haloacid dehalogenase type II [Gammaproteobacteria bacterium]|nr:haloacid dehalogenase type II [Gammaproteobacteria bacterium]